jgi:hypothetical protein
VSQKLVQLRKATRTPGGRVSQQKSQLAAVWSLASVGCRQADDALTDPDSWQVPLGYAECRMAPDGVVNLFCYYRISVAGQGADQAGQGEGSG